MENYDTFADLEEISKKRLERYILGGLRHMKHTKHVALGCSRRGLLGWHLSLHHHYKWKQPEATTRHPEGRFPGSIVPQQQ